MDHKRENESFLKDQSRVLCEDRYCDDPPLIKTLRDAGAIGEDIEVFLRVDGGCRGPSWENVVIKKALLSAQEGRRQPAWGWLDDREKETHRSRPYRSRLTATELRSHLSVSRFGASKLANADRRLIYIQGLGSEYIHALAETVSYYQGKPLKQAICKHLDAQASLEVHMPPHGSAYFSLNFHLPYLALRPRSPTHVVPRGKAWLDLSFLDIAYGEERSPCKYVIHEAHVSIVVCGSGKLRWVAWAFVNNDFGDEPEEAPHEDDEDDDDDDDDDDDEDCHNEPRVDMLPADGHTDADGYVVPANNPIWDPRGYWLLVTEVRLSLAVKEWEYLVKTIGASIATWRDEHSVTLAHNNCSINVTKAYDHTVRTTQLLREMRQRFTKPLKAWKRFSAPGGDIQYFSDLPRNRDIIVLDKIKKLWHELEDLEEYLSSIDESCKEYAQNLSLYMGLDSRRLTLESNYTSQESHRINLRTTQVALENHKTAQLTSETTYKALLMNIFLTPVGIVLAYFGTATAIFGFERNSKSFFVCIVCLITGLQLFFFAIARIRRLCWVERMLTWAWLGQVGTLSTRSTANETIELGDTSLPTNRFG